MMNKKAISLLFPLFLAGFLVLIGCNREAPWPEESYIGKNTFGCRVDGNEWVAQVYRKSDKFSIVVGFHNATPELGLALIANNHRKDRDQSILLETAPLDTFDFTDYPRKVQLLNAVYTDNETETTWSTQTDQFQLEFTRFDTVLRIISGRFEFQASDENGGGVTITDGRFDVIY